MEKKPPWPFVANGQVEVILHSADEQLDLKAWTLPTLDLPALTVYKLKLDPVHIRVEFAPPRIHLSPLSKAHLDEMGIDTLKLLVERRIESELPWMRRFVPEYKQIPRKAAATPSIKAIALRALGLDALADYARFLTHYPAAQVWKIADRMRSATPRFIEPSFTDSRSGWDRRIPAHGELRRRLAKIPPGGASEISLAEILGADSRSLADVVEQWPERYGPRRRLLMFDEQTLPERIFDDLLGARVNASLSPETSDTADRLVEHLRPLLQLNTLAVAYALALMGFTFLQRPLGLASLLDPQIENTAIPANTDDEEMERAHDIAAEWIEAHSV